MRFPDDAPVKPGKRDELRARIARLGIDLDAVEESFARGGGKGGQKINKSANRAVLRYAPLDLIVSCQRERGLALNRFLALRELTDRIEMRISPVTSARLAEFERIRRRKARRRAGTRSDRGSAPRSHLSPIPSRDGIGDKSGGAGA